MKNRIETERLILRLFTKEDINALFAIFSDKDVNIFLPMFPLRNIEEAKEYLRYIEEYAGYYYAICLKENNIPIGCIHISEDDSHDLGYCIGKKVLAQRNLYRSVPGNGRHVETGRHSLYHSYT